MNLLYICTIFLSTISYTDSIKVGKSKINIPYVAPSHESKKKGMVILDGSPNGKGELPFVEITNGDAYVFKTPEEYNETTLTKKERELENMQSDLTNHYDFINDRIGNWKWSV